MKGKRCQCLKSGKRKIQTPNSETHTTDLSKLTEDSGYTGVAPVDSKKKGFFPSLFPDFSDITGMCLNTRLTVGNRLSHTDTVY